MFLRPVLCAHPLGQVKIEENPAFPRLASWNLAVACEFFQRVRVHMQKFSGFGKVERTHGYVC